MTVTEKKRSTQQRVKRAELMWNGKYRLYLVCGHMVVRSNRPKQYAHCTECGKKKNLEYDV